VARRIFLGLDTHRLALVILFVAVFAMAMRVPTDTDTWWHLQAGRVMVESGRVLTTDLFSHTRYGAPWVAYAWLSQVILYLLFHHLSYVGLGLWIGGVLVAAFVFVYLQMEGDVFLRAFIIVLAALTSAVIWAARPQLISLLLTSVLTYILYLFKWRGVNRLWLLPPLFVLWVNLHAGYALGFMVLAAFVAGEALNRVLWLLEPTLDARSEGGDPGRGRDPVLGWRGLGWVVGVALLSALVLVIHPNTTQMWTYYLDTVRIGVLQDFIQEWQSPDFHQLRAQPFIWLLLATLAAAGLSGRRIDGTDLALVGGFAYAALLAGRNIAPFAIVAAPALSRHARPILEGWARTARSRGWLRARRLAVRRPSPRKALLNWTLLFLILAAAGVKAALPLRASFNRAHERETLPLGAIEWIREQQPDGPMFNSYNWGGYLIWHLWPDYLVFVDGRTDLYGDELLRQYLKVHFVKPGFYTILNQHGVNFVVTEAGSFTDNFLALDDGWILAYADDVAVVYVRTER